MFAVQESGERRVQMLKTLDRRTPNPVAECEDRLRTMLAGESSLASQEDAIEAIDAAHRDLTGGHGRDLGAGVALIEPPTQRRDAGDDSEFLCVVTDGRREAAMVVKLAREREATLEDESAEAHVLDCLYDMVGSIRRSSGSYPSLVAHSPLVLS